MFECRVISCYSRDELNIRHINRTFPFKELDVLSSVLQISWGFIHANALFIVNMSQRLEDWLNMFVFHCH